MGREQNHSKVLTVFLCQLSTFWHIFLVLVLFFFSQIRLNSSLHSAWACCHTFLIANQAPLSRKHYFCWFRHPFQYQPAFLSSLTISLTIPLSISFLLKSLWSIISNLSLSSLLHSTFICFPSLKIASPCSNPYFFSVCFPSSLAHQISLGILHLHML